MPCTPTRLAQTPSHVTLIWMARLPNMMARTWNTSSPTSKVLPQPLERVLEWGNQLTQALTYLHTQDPAVIHRDIKPSNIKITPQGHIILVDKYRNIYTLQFRIG